MHKIHPCVFTYLDIHVYLYIHKMEEIYSRMFICYCIIYDEACSVMESRTVVTWQGSRYDLHRLL